MVQTPDLSSVRSVSAPLFEEAADLIAGTVRAGAEDGSGLPAQPRHATVFETRRSQGAPDVSVIIPTFNRPDLVAGALESVAAQTGVTAEIIVVNDGGVDLPPECAQAYARRCHALTIVRHNQNRGLAASRNTGASLASGGWLLMLDDDDALVAGAVETLVGGARDAEFVFGDHVRQHYDGPRLATREYRSTSGERLESLHAENPIMCGSFAIRRESFARLNGYREDLPVHEDYNLHLRVMASLGTTYVAHPICVYHCRTTIPRLNDRRLYWFATSALNHAVFRSLFHRQHDRALAAEQRAGQYAHLLRSLNEGCPSALAEALVEQWWSTLASRDLQSEIAMDRGILASVWPSFVESRPGPA